MPTEENKIARFVAKFWRGILAIALGAITWWSTYQIHHNQTDTNTRRLQNFRDEQKEEKEEINNLKIRISVLEALLKQCR